MVVVIYLLFLAVLHNIYDYSIGIYIYDVIIL